MTPKTMRPQRKSTSQTGKDPGENAKQRDTKTRRGEVLMHERGAFTGRWRGTYFCLGQRVLDNDCPRLHSTWLFHYSLSDFFLSACQVRRPGLSQQCRGTPARSTASTEKSKYKSEL